jgi:glycerate-2-kinase
MARTIDAMVSLTEHLAINDSNHFFQALDDLLIADPTNTTIMNLLIVLIPE